MPCFLRCLSSHTLCVFSERSARRARPPGSPGAAGNARIRRHRRESLNPGPKRREGGCGQRGTL